MKEVKEILNKLKTQGMSNKQIADLLCIDPSEVWRILNGERRGDKALRMLLVKFPEKVIGG